MQAFARGLFAVLLAVAAPSIGVAAFDRSDWTLPSGFNIEPYTPGVSPVPAARSLAVSGSSALNRQPWITYVSALSFAGAPQTINAVVDLYGRGEADYVQPIVRSLSPMPNGIAWRDGALYIASLDPYKSCKLYRLDDADSYALSRRPARISDLVVLLDNLPPDFWHGWKFIRFGPDGKLYIPIGANCNACRTDGTPPNNGTDPVSGQPIFSTDNSQNTSHVSAPYRKEPGAPAWRFGTIYSVNPDGSNVMLVATGVRNTVGFDWHPVTKKLYFTDNGRDNWDILDSSKTDNRPDCELNVATAPGQDFGFPFCHTGPLGGNADYRPYLRPAGSGPNLVDPDLNANQTALKCNGAGLKFRPAIQAMGPHVAPLGMRFYRWFPGANLPQGYDRSIFVAQHGSWNRNRPIGARVMRVQLSSADPTKVLSYTPFLTGGVPGDRGISSGPNPLPPVGASYKGRPVDVEQLPDGSLLVSDDAPAGGTVYRISYSPPLKCRGQGGEEEDGEDRLFPAAIPGLSAGCAVNIGKGGILRYRRCVRMDVSASGTAGHWVQLATSLQVVGGKVVLHGALVVPQYNCINSPGGWIGLGFPRPGETDMVGSNVFITRPAPGTATGAMTNDFYLGGTAVQYFTASRNFLASSTSLKAFVAGGALVTTFDINLPTGFQRAAAAARKIPQLPTTRRGLLASASSLTMLLAMGAVDGTGAMQLSIPFLTSDIGASLPTYLPVLNRGAGPQPAPPPATSPPPSPAIGDASPPPPPAASPTDCAPGAQCCLNGVQYDACMTDSNPGVPYTQYYKLEGNKLRVAISASTGGGWAAWMYNALYPGYMTAGDALFVRPCASCATGVGTPAFNLAGYFTSAFTAPQRVTYTREGSGTGAGGALWAAFSIPWPGGTAIKINYGSGAYTPGNVNGADGMLQHINIPPKACINISSGSATIQDASTC